MQCMLEHNVLGKVSEDQCYMKLTHSFSVFKEWGLFSWYNAKQIWIKIQDAFTMSMKERKGENLGLCQEECDL